MLCLIYVIFIIVALYYAAHQSCPRMAATAAALRQIWSGGCQSCRNSEVSGLSGLDPPPGRSGARANNLREACVCDVCPCAAIDVVVRTATPVASVFDDAVGLLNHVYFQILTLFIDSYEMFNRVLECRTACRHHAQIVDENQYDSLENFSFGLRKSSIITKKPSISLREEDFNQSTTSSRKEGSVKVKAQSLLRLFEKISKERVAKSQGKPDDRRDKTTSAFTENMTSTVSSGEIEPTIAVERTPKVATKEKGVNMRFDEDRFCTEEKGVGISDAESLPCSSREGTSQFPDRSKEQSTNGYFQVSDEREKPISSAAKTTQAYCERCKDCGRLCVPSCPKKHTKK